MKLFGFDISRTKKENRNTVLPFPVTIKSSISRTIDATSQACIDLICSTISTLPLDLYEKGTRGKKEEHALHRVFKEPNADETRSIFFYNMARDYIYGNVYLYKYYNDEGDIVALFRLNPLEMTVYRDTFNKKYFQYKGQEWDYTKILHIPSRWGYDGTVGKSIFDAASSVFTTTSEIDEYTNNAFNQSLGKRLVIDISNAFPNATPEQVEALREKYVANYTGSENAGKPIVKSNKVDLTAIDSGLSDNRATQLLENREFQEREISKLFGVPLSFLKGENKYGDIEGLYQVFLDTAIKPITTTFEESFNKLLPFNERSDLYFEFNYNSMLKTSLQTRIDTYSKQLASGILTINEVRARENLKPIEAGDQNIISGGNFLPLTNENLNAYMASAKEKVSKIDSVGIGDDKK